MNLNGYVAPVVILGLFLMVYLNGTQSVLQPTAHEALMNKTFMSFIVSTSAVLALIIVSMQTRSMPIFFGGLALLSFLFFIFGKSWQYTPV
jgi:hypothetical protein